MIVIVYRLFTNTRDAIWRGCSRPVLAAWRVLSGMLASINQSRHGHATFVPIYHGSHSSNGITPSAGVHCASKVPKTLAGPILPYALDSKPTVLESDISNLDTDSITLEDGKAYLMKTTPSSSLRYQRAKIVRTDLMIFTPDIALASCYESPALQDWQSYIHPEGLIYWFHPSLHVVTDANLQEPYILDKINHWIGEFDDARERASFKFPEVYELFLELDLQEDGCNYYVVDHDRHAIFYLDEANTEHLDLPEVCSIEHLKLQLTEQYWIHLEYFPMHGTLPASAESEITGILSHAWGDQATSSLSTAPYSAEQCKDFLHMLESLAGRPSQDGYKASMIARLMNEFLHSRFINMYGQPEGARLARNQSTLPIPATSDSRLVHILSTVLLNQPRRELTDLNNLWVDKIVYTEHWRAFINTQLQEWRSISLLSAVLLIADTTLVAHFHTRPANWSARLPLTNTSCVAGTLSLLLSICTVVLGVTSILKHQPYSKSHAGDACAYLERVTHETLGLHPLAIALSLPRALFLWALVTAGIALFSFSFQLLDVWNLIFVGIFAALLCSLLVWAIRFFHVRESDSSPFTFTGIPAAAARFFRPKSDTIDQVAESA